VPVGPEDRIVAEATVAARLLGDVAFAGTCRLVLHLTRQGKNEMTREARGARCRRGAGQFLQDALVAFALRDRRVDVPRGVDARLAAERVDDEAGVVGQGGKSHMIRVEERLAASVFRERRSVLREVGRALRQADTPPRRVGEQRRDLAHFARVVRGDQ